MSPCSGPVSARHSASVFLLKPGSIKRDETGRILDARSSVSLITSGQHRIVVDTGLSGEEEQIIQALSDIGLSPLDVDMIINTHDHEDHCGGNHLFSRAKRVKWGDEKDNRSIAPEVSLLATPGHSPDSISVIVHGRLVCSEGMGSSSSRCVNSGRGCTCGKGDASDRCDIFSGDDTSCGGDIFCSDDTSGEGGMPLDGGRKLSAGACDVIVIAGDALPTIGNFLKMVPPALHTDRNLASASLKKIIEIADIVVPGHDYPFSVRK